MVLLLVLVEALRVLALPAPASSFGGLSSVDDFLRRLSLRGDTNCHWSLSGPVLEDWLALGRGFGSKGAAGLAAAAA